VAINGGEDYELLFTIAMEDFEKIKGLISPSLDIYRKVKESNYSSGY
jgi:thiamine monophosphate kinase